MTFFLHIVAMICILLFPVLGYNLVFGKGKIMHFGQEAQSIVAVYTLLVLTTQMHLSYGFSFFCALLAVSCVSLALAWLSLRLTPDGFGVLSIALQLMFLAVVLNWQSVTRGALGISGIPRAPWPEAQGLFVMIMVSSAVLWIACMWVIDTSIIGRQLAALSEHPWYGEAQGISRRRLHIIVFLLSGVGSLLSGAFYSSYIAFLSPSDYDFPAMIFFVMCVVAGRPGSVRGVTIATILLVVLREGIRFIGLPIHLIGPVRLILFGLILFVAVWIRRDSLFPRQRTV